MLDGEVVPPPDRIKRRHLVHLVRSRQLDVFVESGTYLGDTVAYVLPHVQRAITIELESTYWEMACARFEGDERVEVLRGDAIDLIPAVLGDIQRPALVWLDGHFTGGVSTVQGRELEPAPAILRSLSKVQLAAGTTLVVDDLRLFGQGQGFPTLDDLVGSAHTAFPTGRIYAGVDSLVIET